VGRLAGYDARRNRRTCRSAESSLALCTAPRIKDPFTAEDTMKARIARLRPSLLAALLSLPAVLVATATGCAPAEDPAQDPPAPVTNDPMMPGTPTLPEGPLDYYRDARPLLERYCTSCHKAGGIAPFSLEGYENAKAHAAASKLAIDKGYMPPWLPSDKSAPVRYSRALRPIDKLALLRWIDGGAIEGDAKAAPRITPPPAEVAAPPRADLVVDPMVTYTPNQKLQDDYRCFVIDPKLAEDRYLRAAAVKPGNPALVHHVIVFEVAASGAQKIRDRDAKEAGPGYTCYGGPGTNDTQFVFGWAPGGSGLREPDDEGLLLRKGSLLVMQVHYNLLQFKPGDSDHTTVTFELFDSPPPFRSLVVPLANPDQLKIPAGKKDVKQTVEVPVVLYMNYLKLTGDELVISGNSPHMHMLGTAISTTLGGSGQALIDIPRWDFHWQGGYVFREPLKARKNDSIVLECTYDNSYENQPVINGERQMPRDVTWGEGTLDEMCLSFLHLRTPRI
jgi:hypothetical protein